MCNKGTCCYCFVSPILVYFKKKIIVNNEHEINYYLFNQFLSTVKNYIYAMPHLPFIRNLQACQESVLRFIFQLFSRQIFGYTTYFKLQNVTLYWFGFLYHGYLKITSCLKLFHKLGRQSQKNGEFWSSSEKDNLYIICHVCILRLLLYMYGY